MTGVLEIEVNGEPQRLDSPATVAVLIDKRRPRPPFAVELNKQLVRRSAYDVTVLKSGDKIEIVTLVGGG